MSFIRKSVGAGALVALLASMAAAQEPAPIVRTHDPALAACAAVIDVVYLPLRLATTLVGGVLGGFVGFITLGDKAAAESIWALSDGSQIVTPEMLEGVEPFHWTGYD
jgi:ABC-type transport system involved in cytochrome c biogenesis permease subunit